MNWQNIDSQYTLLPFGVAHARALWTSYGIIEWGFELTDALGFLDMLFHLSELFAGLLLVIVGIRLIGTNFLESIKKEKLVVYFLLLWAASFFFIGLYNIIDHGPWMFEYWNCLLGFLSGLAGLIAGITLALFSWNILNETD